MTQKGDEVSDGGSKDNVTHFTRVSNVPRAIADQFAVPLAEEGSEELGPRFNSATKIRGQVSIRSVIPVRYQMCPPALIHNCRLQTAGSTRCLGTSPSPHVRPFKDLH